MQVSEIKNGTQVREKRILHRIRFLDVRLSSNPLSTVSNRTPTKRHNISAKDLIKI